MNVPYPIMENLFKFSQIRIFFRNCARRIRKVQSQKPFTIEINNQQYYSQIRTNTVIIDLMTLLNFKYEK